MIAPCGMYTHPSRLRAAAAVLTVGVSAGTIASSSGSASAVPRPFRMRRRGMDRFVTNI